MKIHRFIQVLAVLAIVLHGTGAVRSFHNLTHHAGSSVSTSVAGLSGDCGHSESSESDSNNRAPLDPVDPADEDCELCFALDSVLVTAWSGVEMPAFTVCDEQRVDAQADVWVYSAGFDHLGRAPPYVVDYRFVV